MELPKKPFISFVKVIHTLLKDLIQKYASGLFRDASLEATKNALFVDTPIDEEVEILKLTDSLTMLREFDAPYAHGSIWNAMIVKLGEYSVGKRFLNLSPKQLATLLVTESKVRDVAERKRLVEGGFDAVTKSQDPMIQLANLLEPWLYSLRKKYTENVTVLCF